MPARLFIFSMLSFFAVASFTLLSDIDPDSAQKESFYKGYFDKQLKIDFDSTYNHLINNDSISYDQMSLDSFRKEFFAAYVTSRESQEIGLMQPDPDKPGSLINSSIYVEYADLIELTPDEIIEKYEIKKFWNKIFARQTIKLMTDMNGAIRFIIGNITWTLIVLMPIVAGFMFLIYIRRNHFFVEHLIFLFHFHSFIFFILSIFLLVENYLPSRSGILLTLLIFAYLFMAQRKFYGQGFLKTLLKFFMTIFFYLIAILLTTIATVIISFGLL